MKSQIHRNQHKEIEFHNEEAPNPEVNEVNLACQARCHQTCLCKKPSSPLPTFNRGIM